MANAKVLVTGMSGLIGGIVRKQLEKKYELSALNRSEVEGVQCFCADIGNLKDIQPAFEGKDTVIHLAAKSSLEASWEEVLQHNLIGTYNVFEASRRAGVKRVVYASSGATTAGWELDSPYRELVEGRYDQLEGNWKMLTPDHLVRPKGLYGCSKLWGEALARHFSDTFDMSFLCLRIGQVTKENRPQTLRQFSIWCSQQDIAQMIDLCASAPDELRFEIFYVVSDNRWNYRDISHSREVLGFQPMKSAENYREN